MKMRTELRHEAFSALVGRKTKSPNDFYLIFFSLYIGESKGLKESIRDKLAGWRPHPVLVILNSPLLSNLFLNTHEKNNPVVDPGFPSRGHQPQRWGRKSIFLNIFLKKTALDWKKLDPLDTPL